MSEKKPKAEKKAKVEKTKTKSPHRRQGQPNFTASSLNGPRMLYAPTLYGMSRKAKLARRWNLRFNGEQVSRQRKI